MVFITLQREYYCTLTDRGQSWESKRFDGVAAPDVTSLYAVKYLDANTIITAGFNGSILKTIDQGISWTSVAADTNWSIWNLRGKDNFLLATGITVENDINIHKLYTSTDAGDSWSELATTLPEGFGIEAVEVADNGKLYGFGNQGGNYAIAVSEDDGSSWSTLYRSDDEGSLKSGFVSSSRDIYAGGENGKIVFHLQGEAWEEIGFTEDVSIWRVHGAGDDIYFSAASGKVYAYNKNDDKTSAVGEKKGSGITTFYDSTNHLLTIEGVSLSKKYSMKISSIDGRHSDYPVQGNSSIDVSTLLGGAYTYMLLEGGEPIVSGKFIKN